MLHTRACLSRSRRPHQSHRVFDSVQSNHHRRSSVDYQTPKHHYHPQPREFPRHRMLPPTPQHRHSRILPARIRPTIPGRRCLQRERLVERMSVPRRYRALHHRHIVTGSERSSGQDLAGGRGGVCDAGVADVYRRGHRWGVYFPGELAGGGYERSDC